MREKINFTEFRAKRAAGLIARVVFLAVVTIALLLAGWCFLIENDIDFNQNITYPEL